MRTWIVPLLALLAGGCAAPAEPTAQVPLTWTGAFGGGRSTPGQITLLFDEVGDTWTGSMYFEANEPDGDRPRVTYRIEGVREDGTIRFDQKEVLQADPLSGGRSWCLGTYELALDEGKGEGPMGLTGAYSAESSGCSGSTSLQPAETF